MNEYIDEDVYKLINRKMSIHEVLEDYNLDIDINRLDAPYQNVKRFCGIPIKKEVLIDDGITQLLLYLSKRYPDLIISGSIVLKIFGIIDRKIGDIDVIINNDKMDNFTKDVTKESLLCIYDNDATSGYSNHNTIIEVPVLTYTTSILTKHQYIIDVFVNDSESDNNIIEYEYDGILLKLQHPFNIIRDKIELNRYKDFSDINYILMNNLI